MRRIGDHDTPSLEVVITTSLPLQPGSKRQSTQARYTLPAPSIFVGSRISCRKDSPGKNVLTVAIVRGSLQLAPPSVEVNTLMAVSSPLLIGTITVPSGWTTG